MKPPLPPDVPRPDPAWELDVPDEAIAYDGQLHDYWDERRRRERGADLSIFGLSRAAKAWGGAAIGAFIASVAPYVLAWSEGSDPFDWRKVAGLAVAAAAMGYATVWKTENKGGQGR